VRDIRLKSRGQKPKGRSRTVTKAGWLRDCDVTLCLGQQNGVEGKELSGSKDTHQGHTKEKEETSEWCNGERPNYYHGNHKWHESRESWG